MIGLAYMTYAYLKREGSIIDFMHRITVFVVILVGITLPCMLLAGAEKPSRQPSARERLNQVLDSEGGVHVYKDHKGNVETTIDLPNDKRRTIVQPPPSPGLNLGPPLQLNNPPFQFPPPPPPPAQPSAPEFPQRAH